MTDLIHVDDLTTNTTRLDMLDETTQQRLSALPLGEREWWSGAKWHEDYERRLYVDITYRQKPKPETVVHYISVCDYGVSILRTSLASTNLDDTGALSYNRIETCTKTVKLISAENVEVGDE